MNKFKASVLIIFLVASPVGFSMGLMPDVVKKCTSPEEQLVEGMPESLFYIEINDEQLHLICGNDQLWVLRQTITRNRRHPGEGVGSFTKYFCKHSGCNLSNWSGSRLGWQDGYSSVETMSVYDFQKLNLGKVDAYSSSNSVDRLNSELQKCLSGQQ